MPERTRTSIRPFSLILTIRLFPVLFSLTGIVRSQEFADSPAESPTPRQPRPTAIALPE